MKDGDNLSTESQQAPKGSLGEHLRRRWLRGLVAYPLVLLLACVLITIRIVEAFGLYFWMGGAAAGVAGWWYTMARRPGAESQTREAWSSPSRAPYVSLVSMIAIAGAYGVLHQYGLEQQRRQMDAWQMGDIGGEALERTSAPTWQPIAVRAVIEETLRYRRSTTPRASSSTLSDRDANPDDDTSSQAELHWQTLTRVRVVQARHGDGWRSSQAFASLVVDDTVRGSYPGDLVELYGHWRLPPEPSNPGQFDLRARYAELGLSLQLRVDSTDHIARVRTAEYLRLDRPLAMVTGYALETIERFVPFGQAPLTAALVLGQREQAHWQLQEELLATGTIHMLSISGMHIDMVAVALMVAGLMLRIPRGPMLVAIAVICGLYALLCGANPPVARAALMLTAGCVARLLRWQFTSLNILAGAALVLLIPRTSIAFEIGTQLSFLTVAVLILTFPILHRRQTPLQRLLESRQTVGQVAFANAKRFAWESLRSSFWVCFLSAPLVWSTFHILSPIAIALNLVLWLPMLIALLTGLALIFVGWLPPVAALLGMLCGGSLWILTQCVAIAESIPLSHFWRAAPPTWWLTGFYALALSISIWRGTKRVSARRLLWRSLAVWFALGIVWEPSSLWYRNAASKTAEGKLAVTWIDVGHGTCAVIETPNGEFWVYDAGRLGDSERSYQPIANALWHMGYSRIDRLILSHADSDHYNAMPGIAVRFSPREFTTTDSVMNSEKPFLTHWFEQLRKRAMRIDRWRKGDRYLGRGGWSIESLHPLSEQSNAPKWSDNAKSLVLAIRFAGRTVLLPGDLEPPGTQSLVSQPSMPCDVIMAPHHGSLAAQAERVIAWSQPTWVVISGSARAASQRVIDRFTPPGGSLAITSRDHAIRTEIDGRGALRMMRWNRSKWEELPITDPHPRP